MDIDSINAETGSIRFTAHQFWEQEGPRKLLMDTHKRLSVNEKAYQRVPINSDGRALHSFQQKMLQRVPSGKVE